MRPLVRHVHLDLAEADVLVFYGVGDALVVAAFVRFLLVSDADRLPGSQHTGVLFLYALSGFKRAGFHVGYHEVLPDGPVFRHVDDVVQFIGGDLVRLALFILREEKLHCDERRHAKDGKDRNVYRKDKFEIAFPFHFPVTSPLSRGFFIGGFLLDHFEYRVDDETSEYREDKSEDDPRQNVGRIVDVKVEP